MLLLGKIRNIENAGTADIETGRTKDHAAVDWNEQACAWITYREANVVHLPEATRAVDWSCIHVTVRFLSVDVAEFNLSYVSTFLGDEVHSEKFLWQSRHEFFHEGMLLWVSCESR